MFDWPRASQSRSTGRLYCSGIDLNVLVNVSPASWDDENSTIFRDTIGECTRGEGSILQKGCWLWFSFLLGECYLAVCSGFHSFWVNVP